jgi:hypothetical protein
VKALSPKLKTTKVGNSPWEWIPNTFEDFLVELEFVAAHCKDLGHLGCIVVTGTESGS